MRSLYTDDIAGTRSKITIFHKSRFKQKYDRFAKSNQKNPQHKKYQWYVPLGKQRSGSVAHQPRYTLKLMSQHTGLSKSGHFDQFKKVHETQRNECKNQKSILAHSGRSSVGQIKNKAGIDNSPYFPHRYQDYKQSRIKWSGNRNWNYDQKNKLQLPNITKSKLISYF